MHMAGPTTNHHEIRSCAQTHQLVPAELLPRIVNGEPPLLQITQHHLADSRADIHILTWEDFFARFDQMGLALVYANDSSGFNELLQRDELSPYRSRYNIVRKPVH